jgi:nucleoside-triphosphatase THEP1
MLPMSRPEPGDGSLRPAPITIITGPRDSGKTKTAASMAARFMAEGRTLGGVIANAELRDGVKVSYSLFDLATRASMTYARRRIGPVPAGALAYEFLDKGLEFGCAAIRRAIAENVNAVFVDEIGPLEMNGLGLWEPVREARSAHAGLLVLTVRPDLLSFLLVKLAVRPEEARIIRLPDDPARGQGRP